MNDKATRGLFAALFITVTALLSVLVPTPWTGIGFSLTLGILFFSGYSISASIEGLRKARDAVESARLLVVSVGLGLSMALALWTVSSYLTGELLPGTVSVLALAALGGLRAVRCRPRVGYFFSSRTALLLSSVTLMTGLYIFGINEIQLGDTIYFTYRTDWATHTAAASLVSASGLPLVSPYGSPQFPYMHVTHVGYPVILAGLADLFCVSVFQAARLITVLCYWLIPVAAWCVVQGFGLGKKGALLASFSGLLASGLLLPYSLITRDFLAVVDPYMSAVLRMNVASGTLYHNGTQLVSVALVAVALVALDRFCRQSRLSTLAVAAALITASGLVKPSTFIVFAPALAITVALSRHSRTGLVTVIGIFVIGSLIYMLPSFLNPVPAVWVKWSASLANLLDIHRVAAPLNMLGIGLAPLAYWAFRRSKQIIASRAFEWYDVGVIALFGGIAFSTLFSESGRGAHGNRNWSATSAAVLVSPYLIATLVGWCRKATDRSPAVRVGKITIAVALTFQLLQSGIYMVTYPLLFPQQVPMKQIAVIERAKALTRPGDRFLVDPELEQTMSNALLRSYLGRPILHDCSPYPREVHREYALWRAVSEGRARKSVTALLRSREAIIIGERTRHLVRRVARLGWKKQKIDPDRRFELWRAY